MATGAKKVDAYGFTPAFEKALVFLMCSRPRFYGRVGHGVDPEALRVPAGKDAVLAAHAIAKDVGHGPESPLLVLQRLRRWQEEGRVTHEQVVAVSDLIDEVEDSAPPSEDGVATEVVPVLKRRLEHGVAQAAFDAVGKKGDMERVEAALHKAKTIGVSDVSLGTKLGGASFQIIEGMKHLERLPTGILELDAMLSGGPSRGQLGMWVGAPGKGKSMCLNQCAAAAALEGMSAAIATLELPEAIWLARLKANILEMPIDSIMNGDPAAKVKLAATTLGPVMVKYFTPMSTTTDDLREWLKQIEEASGRKVDVLIVDYADKMGAPIKDKSSYAQMGVVYEGLRTLLVERMIWGWTASQSQGRKDEKKSKVVDLEHVADSSNKGRVVDLAITLNVDDDTGEASYFVAKNRTGKSRFTVGPLPLNYAMGMMTPVNRAPVTWGAPGSLFGREPGQEG